MTTATATATAITEKLLPPLKGLHDLVRDEKFGRGDIYKDFQDNAEERRIERIEMGLELRAEFNIPGNIDHKACPIERIGTSLSPNDCHDFFILAKKRKKRRKSKLYIKKK